MFTLAEIIKVAETARDGAFSLSCRAFDIWTILAFRGLCSAVVKVCVPTVPFDIGLILGQMSEPAVRHGQQLSQGNLSGLPTNSISRPIAAGGQAVLNPGYRGGDPTLCWAAAAHGEKHRSGAFSVTSVPDETGFSARAIGSLGGVAPA